MKTMATILQIRYANAQIGQLHFPSLYLQTLEMRAGNEAE